MHLAISIAILSGILAEPLPSLPQEGSADGIEWGSRRWERPETDPPESLQDGVELQRDKEGCTCRSRLPKGSGDGVWNSPWWCCPIHDTATPPPVSQAPFHLAFQFRVLDFTVIADQITVFNADGTLRDDPYDGGLFEKIKPGRKSSYLGGDGGSGTVDDSDSPFLVGPELAYPLKEDVSEWGLLEWLPEGSALRIYGRALYGEMEVFQFETDLEIYSLGLGLSIPVVTASPFSLAATMSAGPSWLRTDFGNVMGLDAGVGLAGRLALGRSLGLTASVEETGFFAEDVSALGPALSFGFDLSW